MNRHLLTFSFAGLLILGLNCSAQQRTIKSDISATLDSLQGFDEQSVRNIAIEHGVSADETELFVSHSKREFIKSKYKLVTSVNPDVHGKVATPVCNNEDFEDFSFTYPVPYTATITTVNGITGWTSTRTTISGSTPACSIAATTSSLAPDAISVIAPGPAGLTDAIIGSSYPIHSVFGYFANNGGITTSGDTMRGEWFVKINNQVANFGLNRISKTLSVTATNATFKFAVIIVVQGSHCCCDSPAFDITFKDCSNNVLPLGTYSVAPNGGAGCTPTLCTSSSINASMISSTVSAGWVYNKWAVNTVDLSPYIGTCVTIEVTAVDCAYGGHPGYAYFDAQCGASLTTGIAETQVQNATQLYPNPNAGEFTLNIGKNITKGEIEIENALGQIVFKQDVSQGENSIQTKNLAGGVYYYSVIENKVVLNKGKVVISH